MNIICEYRIPYLPQYNLKANREVAVNALIETKRMQGHDIPPGTKFRSEYDKAEKMLVITGSM